MSEILGVLFAVLIGTMIFPRFAQYQRVTNDNLIASTTAQQQKTLIEAGTAYIKQYATTIQTTATATAPAIITVPMLQAPAVNLLDASYSATNPYGQTWQIEVLQPSAGNLQALVMSTGGTALSDTQGAKIASIVGAQGGLIPKNDSGIYAGGAANAFGTSGGWTIPTANYTSVTGGHPAALITFNNGQLVSNYLYRNAVPGQPQLNQMNTSLDMGTNNITNAQKITASSTVQGGEFYTSPKTVGTACTNNGAMASGTSGNGVVMVCSNGTWQIAIDRANPGAACSPDGKPAISTATTEQLVCKNSVYVRMVNLLAKYVEVARYTVQDGDVVPMPTCDAGGTPSFSFITTATAVDVAVSPPKQGMQLTASVSGGSWIVSILLKDNFGGTASGNVYGIKEGFRAECRY
ncbi:MAG TPA: shufflon system plasmid conjugative transfer pilus tip adhesin PilV [Noviherbaspirillum sp.]|nr:shufflon system plasmid conjugative transfer pilus tip adhesin PilV [Noviherbaspirillum sp.]